MADLGPSLSETALIRMKNLIEDRRKWRKLCKENSSVNVPTAEREDFDLAGTLSYDVTPAV